MKVTYLATPTNIRSGLQICILDMEDGDVSEPYKAWNGMIIYSRVGNDLDCIRADANTKRETTKNYFIGEGYEERLKDRKHYYILTLI